MKPFNKQGFTLIEILVAMMVLAISLVSIMQLFAGGLRASQISGDYLKAVFLADQIMEETLLNKSTSEGVVEGDNGHGYTWKTTISPYETDYGLSENNLPGIYNQFIINVDVWWKFGSITKHFSLASTTLGRSNDPT